LSNAIHNDIVRECVAVLQLVPDNKLMLYSTTSIRNGNQTMTEELVQKFRAQRNTDFGWKANIIRK
jgi:hypothetical protein